jgi:hypothetical protein
MVSSSSSSLQADTMVNVQSMMIISISRFILPATRFLVCDGKGNNKKSIKQEIIVATHKNTLSLQGAVACLCQQDVYNYQMNQ